MKRKVVLTDQLLGVLGIALLRHVVDCRNHAILCKETGWMPGHCRDAEQRSEEAREALNQFNKAVFEAMKSHKEEKVPLLTIGG